MVWADLARALRELLLEQDYDSINMGHIAARAGLARNTLYNYAQDKGALVLALTERASRSVVERVAAIARRGEMPPAQRMREIIVTFLEESTDQTLQMMFRPGAGALVAAMPKTPGNPFNAIVAEVEDVVRAGVAAGEFRELDDVQLAVELLSGVMRAGAERIGRDPEFFEVTVQAAQDIILASLNRET